MSQSPLSFQVAYKQHLYDTTMALIERCTEKIIAARLHLEQTGECSLYFVQRPAPEGVLLTLPPRSEHDATVMSQDD